MIRLEGCVLKNTLDAIRYGLETLHVTPKELFSLIESSNGYDGDNYNRWLANEIIKLAEKDGIGYSHLLAKWFNLIQSIVEEYSNGSMKDSYKNKIIEMSSNSCVYTVGIHNSEIGTELEEVDWGSRLDLPYNYDFIDTLPEELSTAITSGEGATLLVKFNPKGSFKKSSDLLSDAKLNRVAIRNFDSLVLYRVCTMARAIEDICPKFKFVFITNTNFLFDPDNKEVINHFLSHFKYSGFVVDSKDLFEGSYSSEEYAICECTIRTVGDGIQDGFQLAKGIEDGGTIISIGKTKRYSAGSNMLEALYKKYPMSSYIDNVPMIDRSLSYVKPGKGVKSAFGYMCKGVTDRSVILHSYPLVDTDYIAITKDNIYEIIAYYGVSVSMDNAGMFLGIEEIIDGHPDFKNLVSNCVPLFLFDVNSRFADSGTIETKTGKSHRLVNRLDIITSSIVNKLIDDCSVYFSFEAKELMEVCQGLLKFFNDNCGDSMVGKSFEEIRKDCDNPDLNRTYINALSRCKDYVSSLYRQMEI